jgi:hypothetical protein
MNYINKINKMNFFGKYIIGMSAYGTIRKALYLHDAEKYKYDFINHKIKKIPLLTSQKVVLSALSGALAIYLWPYYFYNDIKIIEISLTNKNIYDYGFFRPENEFDFLLM